MLLLRRRSAADPRQLHWPGGALYPQLDGSGSFTRSDSGTTLASNQSSMGFKTQWELDLFGGNRRGVEVVPT